MILIAKSKEIVNRIHIFVLLGAVSLAICINGLLVFAQEEPSNKTTKGDQLYVQIDKTTLGIGESAQLLVTLRNVDLSVVNVTNSSTGTRYFTTDESMLIPEADGKITCVGTHGEQVESAIVGVDYEKAHNHVSVNLVANGPGLTLEFIPQKTTLTEGESIRFRVFDRKGKTDLTFGSTGTHYLVFSGYGVPDTDALHSNVQSIQIDDEQGTFTALKSLGEYQSLHPVVFARNGSSVGWIELKIVKKGSAQAPPTQKQK